MQRNRSQEFASIVWAVGACIRVLALWNRFVVPMIGRATLVTIEK